MQRLGFSLAAGRKYDHAFCSGAIGVRWVQGSERSMMPEEAVRVLSEQAHTLRQEFAMEISGGRLCSLPDLMGGILPQPRALPQLLLDLARAFTVDGLDAPLACQVGQVWGAEVARVCHVTQVRSDIARRDCRKALLHAGLGEVLYSGGRQHRKQLPGDDARLDGA